jgi:biotin carboxyl carrier protein
MKISLRDQSGVIELDLQAEGEQYAVDVDGRRYLVTVRGEALVIDGHQHNIGLARDGRTRLVAVGGEVYRFEPHSGSGHAVDNVASPEVIAPMPGKILQVLVKVGDQVAAGDGLVVLEAMKMETRLSADGAATVREVRVAAGDMINGGQVLAVLEYS